MSADNGIYIAHFQHDNTWRVIHAQAIENLNWYPSGSQEELNEWISYFCEGYPAASLEAAYEYAHALEALILADSFCPILEYGITVLGEGPDIGLSTWTLETDYMTRVFGLQAMENFQSSKTNK